MRRNDTHRCDKRSDKQKREHKECSRVNDPRFLLKKNIYANHSKRYLSKVLLSKTEIFQHKGKHLPKLLSSSRVNLLENDTLSFEFCITVRFNVTKEDIPDWFLLVFQPENGHECCLIIASSKTQTTGHSMERCFRQHYQSKIDNFWC